VSKAGPLRMPRVGFAIYALILVTATHWPELKIEAGNIERPDLILHFGAFGLWAALAVASGFFGNRSSTQNYVRTIALGVVYAAIDESSQAIPIIRRTAVWDDYFANCTGILLGATAALALFRWRKGGES